MEMRFNGTAWTHSEPSLYFGLLTGVHYDFTHSGSLRVDDTNPCTINKIIKNKAGRQQLTTCFIYELYIALI